MLTHRRVHRCVWSTGEGGIGRSRREGEEGVRRQKGSGLSGVGENVGNSFLCSSATTVANADF